MVPPVLLGSGAFVWLWTLPIGILSFLNLQAYRLVEGNMNETQHAGARRLGWVCLLNLAAGLAMFVIAKGRELRTNRPAGGLHPGWGLAPIGIQAAFLWFAVSQTDVVLPASVMRWIYPPERYLYNQFAFAMLPLFLGIMRLASGWRVRRVGVALATSLGIAVLAPVLLVALARLLDFFRGRPFPGIVLALAVVLLGIAMFVGLVRALLLGVHQLTKWRHGERIAIAVFALVLPLGGLALNRTIPFPVDFQAWEVYALVVTNAAILLLASWRHAQWPRLSFYLLCATLPFSLYFFIVFLPFTPLSILAILALGTGFLVLAPTLLFTLHLYLLNQARRSPLVGSGRKLVLAGIGCFLLLPAFFTVRGLADKAALNAALDYVYTPAIRSGDVPCRINQVNLRRALASHRNYKNGIYYPLLSDYYSWLVFDNLVLPDDKLARLEEIFIGAPGSRESHDPVRHRRATWSRGTVRDRALMPRAAPPPLTVEVSAAEMRTRPAGEQATVATLTLQLKNTGTAPAEFAQAFHLPAGVLASGFRLYLNNVAVPGRIVEKKTALWVYTMIRDTERRDPGLLFYDGPGQLQLRVFPVNSTIPSRVEIDFLVPATVNSSALPANGGDVGAILAQLDGFVSPQPVDTDRGTVVIGSLNFRKLPAVDREAYLHVIVDRSADNGFVGDIATALEQLQRKFPAARSARVTLANYRVADLAGRRTPLADFKPPTEADLDAVLPRDGGLDLDLAVARAIRQHRDLDLDGAGQTGGPPPTPIFVVLSRNPNLRADPLAFTRRWDDVLPALEIHHFHDGRVDAWQGLGAAPTRPVLRLGNSIRPLVSDAVTRFQPAARDARLEYWSPADSNWEPLPEVVRRENSRAWLEGMALQLREQDFARSPGDAGVDLKSLVGASRASGILLPVTSYIVVENEAQRRMLDVSESRKLGQNAALDFLETPAPPAVFIAVAFGLWLGFRRWCRQRATASAPT